MTVRLYNVNGWWYEHVYLGGKMIKRSLRTRDRVRAESLIKNHQKMIEDSVLGGNMLAMLEDLKVPMYRSGRDGNFSQLKDEVIHRYLLALERFQAFCMKRNVVHIFQVDKKLINDYIVSMRGFFSDGTIRGQVMSLSSIWRANGLQSIFGKEHVTLRTVEAKRNNISEDDISLILALSKQKDSSDIYCVLLLGARLGMRLGDCCMLRKDELQNGRIVKHLRKTRFFLSIKIPKDMRSLLEGRQTRSEWMFPRLAKLYVTGKRWQLSRWVNQSIERVIPRRIEKLANRQRGASRYSFHSLRHSFIVRLLEAGVKAHVVKELAGVSISLILSRYGDHVKQADKDHAMTIINKK